MKYPAIIRREGVLPEADLSRAHILCGFTSLIILALFPVFTIAEPKGPDDDEKTYVWEEDYNFGQDPLNPVWRLDLRQGYASFPDSYEALISTVRLDAIWNLGEEAKNGQLYWRNDVLFLVRSDVPSIDNPQGRRQRGFGDMLSQAFWILPNRMTKNIPTVEAFGLGIQLEIPAANEDNLGSNQWVLSPGIGGQWALNEPGTAVLTALLFYSRDIKTTSDGKGQTNDIHQLRLQPISTFIIKPKFGIDYITLYDTDQIILDLDSGDIFFPFQVQFGRKLSTNSILSLEYTKKLFHTGDLDLYDWQLTARLGIFF